MIEQLADKGNGNYAYIDSDRRGAQGARRADAGGTLVTIAKDVKIQIEFNPAQVAAYRLIGYENRRLADRGFQRRHQGRRRNWRGTYGHGAVRNRAGIGREPFGEAGGRSAKISGARSGESGQTTGFARDCRRVVDAETEVSAAGWRGEHTTDLSGQRRRSAVRLGIARFPVFSRGCLVWHVVAKFTLQGGRLVCRRAENCPCDPRRGQAWPARRIRGVGQSGPAIVGRENRQYTSHLAAAQSRALLGVKDDRFRLSQPGARRVGRRYSPRFTGSSRSMFFALGLTAGGLVAVALLLAVALLVAVRSRGIISYADSAGTKFGPGCWHKKVCR